MNTGGLGALFAYEGNGTVRNGFPVTFSDVIGTGPAVGDVDDDGVPEIFIAAFDALHGVDPNGVSLSGFPYSPGPAQTFNDTTPSLADMDVDGDREVITATSHSTQFSGQVHVVQVDGTSLSGWPQTTARNCFSPPSVADIDGDGWLDDRRPHPGRPVVRLGNPDIDPRRDPVPRLAHRLRVPRPGRDLGGWRNGRDERDSSQGRALRTAAIERFDDQSADQVYVASPPTIAGMNVSVVTPDATAPATPYS